VIRVGAEALHPDRRPWTEKYRPRRVSEVEGNPEAIKAFLDWIRSWGSGRPSKKAVLLHGPPGTGKTSLVLAFAEENGYDLVQVNASDRRSAEDLENLLGQAIRAASVFGRKRIVLIDEVDGLSTTADAGGVRAIASLIDRTEVPIVLVANDPWDPALQELRTRCEMIEFRRLRAKEIVSRLEEICRREGFNVGTDVLEAIAERSHGDMRAAINDLQLVVTSGAEPSRVLESIPNRLVELNAFELLGRIFGTRRFADGRGTLSNTDLDTDTVFTWVLDNLENQIRDPKALHEAYRILADADLHLKRANRLQRWELMKYGTILLSAGPGVIKATVAEKGGRFEFPSRIRFMQQTKDLRALSDSILTKVTKRLHMSTAKAATEFLPYLRLMLKSGDKGIARYFRLTEQEVEHLVSRAPELKVEPVAREAVTREEGKVKTEARRARTKSR
jgi:replication factor C large subunit